MCFQNVDFNDVDDDTTRWLCTLTYENIYVCDYDMDFNLMVMLRSTTGLYGRPVIEVAYGEMVFHSTEAV